MASSSSSCSSIDIENPTREQCVFLAKLAEQTQRYNDMAEYMKKLIYSTTPEFDLTLEERDLVAVSFKNMTGSIRSAWRIFSAIEKKEMSQGGEEKAAIVRAYKSNLEIRLSEMCENILELIEFNLLPSAKSSNSKVFYLKLKGDYNRYIAEIKDGHESKNAADITLASYESAQIIARADLVPTNPSRLGLALNFSVFYYQILNQTDKAIEMAKQDYEEAMSEIDTLEEETYRDSVLIIQLLKENLTLWTSDSQE